MKMLGLLVVRVAVRVRERRFLASRLVILVEAGTHLIFDALICPYTAVPAVMRYNNNNEQTNFLNVENLLS